VWDNLDHRPAKRVGEVFVGVVLLPQCNFFVFIATFQYTGLICRFNNIINGDRKIVKFDFLSSRIVFELNNSAFLISDRRIISALQLLNSFLFLLYKFLVFTKFI